jgi:hypothetical protein
MQPARIWWWLREISSIQTGAFSLLLREILTIQTGACSLLLGEISMLSMCCSYPVAIVEVYVDLRGIEINIFGQTDLVVNR